jgi:hypothetical protein
MLLERPPHLTLHLIEPARAVVRPLTPIEQIEDKPVGVDVVEPGTPTQLLGHPGLAGALGPGDNHDRRRAIHPSQHPTTSPQHQRTTAARHRRVPRDAGRSGRSRTGDGEVIAVQLDDARPSNLT